MPVDPMSLVGTTHSDTDALRDRVSTTTDAYSRFVPREFLHLMGNDDIRTIVLGQQVERKMTILFADIRDFTALSESMSPQENFNFLNSYLVQMEPVITQHGGFIDKYIGDGIMALFPDSPDAAMQCALAMLHKLDDYNAGRKRAGYRPIKIGIGINTGVVILGTIGGAARMDVTVIGDAVNLAARLERLTKDYRVSILISEYTLYSLEQPAPWSIRFLDRTQVRGKQGTQTVYEVFNGDPASLRETKRAGLKDFEAALAHFHTGDSLTARARLLAYLESVPDDEAAQAYLQRCDTPTEHFDDRDDFPDNWREEYNFGLAAIDTAHIRLLADMDGLAAAVSQDSPEQTAQLLARIQLAAEREFRVMEDMMREEDYPFISLHQRQHQRFFEYFAELRRDIELGEEDGTYLAFRVRRFLTDWLVNHILSADRHFSHFRRSGRDQS